MAKFALRQNRAEHGAMSETRAAPLSGPILSVAFFRPTRLQFWLDDGPDDRALRATVH